MFELLSHKNETVKAVSDEKALELLKGFCRDTEETLSSLKNNPFGMIVVLNGNLRYNPNTSSGATK